MSTGAWVDSASLDASAGDTGVDAGAGLDGAREGSALAEGVGGAVEAGPGADEIGGEEVAVVLDEHPAAVPASTTRAAAMPRVRGLIWSG